mmetsp:Transcript_22978/g.35471  ORF Transcript_22978/g.35471 Transcript_22978/m.35471 type:complete len:248 (-) Transcript_22978:992-1735(-)
MHDLSQVDCDIYTLWKNRYLGNDLSFLEVADVKIEEAIIILSFREIAYEIEGQHKILIRTGAPIEREEGQVVWAYSESKSNQTFAMTNLELVNYNCYPKHVIEQIEDWYQALRKQSDEFQTTLPPENLEFLANPDPTFGDHFSKIRMCENTPIAAGKQTGIEDSVFEELDRSTRYKIIRVVVPKSKEKTFDFDNFSEEGSLDLDEDDIMTEFRLFGSSTQINSALMAINLKRGTVERVQFGHLNLNE